MKRTSDGQTAILVHGGAGLIPESSAVRSERRKGCRQAAEAGWDLLQSGSSAIDAVQAAIVVMEDNPNFNAGTGSVLNKNGTVETDAALMTGHDLRAGGIAAVSGIKNPIKLARAVMDHSAHVLLTGTGVEPLVNRYQIETCDPRDLIVPWQQELWREKHGTVGAVACDAHGRLAVGTSTGGIFDKSPGRIGDSALIGCGTYADDRIAVSATGDGEAIIRMTLARLAACYASQGEAVDLAVKKAMNDFANSGLGEAGLIAVDSTGRLGVAHHAPAMVVAGFERAELFEAY